MKQPSITVGLTATVLSIGAASASAAEMTPLIVGYGKTAAVQNAGERPDLAIDYTVVMSVTKADGVVARSDRLRARLH